MLTKSYVAHSGELEQKWYLVDGAGKVVGRLATEIATILMGKHRPTYTPNVDTGEYVVVINADQLVFTGRKWEQKEYTYYTGYHRLRADTAGERKETQPELILIEAVRCMLPKNKLATKMLEKLKVFAGTEHPHQAQKPEPKELGVRKENTKKKK